MVNSQQFDTLLFELFLELTTQNNPPMLLSTPKKKHKKNISRRGMFVGEWVGVLSVSVLLQSRH